MKKSKNTKLISISVMILIIAGIASLLVFKGSFLNKTQRENTKKYESMIEKVETSFSFKNGKKFKDKTRDGSIEFSNNSDDYAYQIKTNNDRKVMEGLLQVRNENVQYLVRSIEFLDPDNKDKTSAWIEDTFNKIEKGKDMKTKIGDWEYIMVFMGKPDADEEFKNSDKDWVSLFFWHKDSAI